jgi:hypothetical protein
MKFRDFINETPKDGDKKAYQAFFDKLLKKYKVESPEDLSDEDKKKFFDEVDAGWKADKETDLDEAIGDPLNYALKDVETLEGVLLEDILRVDSWINK